MTESNPSADSSALAQNGEQHNTSADAMANAERFKSTANEAFKGSNHAAPFWGKS